MKTRYKKIIGLLFMLFCLANQAVSGSAVHNELTTKPKSSKVYTKEGDLYFKQYKLKEAIASYQEALKVDADKKMYLTRQIARSYKSLFDYSNAKIWYDKLMSFSSDISGQDILEYAHLLKNLQEYSNAIEMYRRYEKTQSGKPDTDNFVASCEWAKAHLNDKPVYKTYQTNLETGGVFLGADFYNSGLLFGAISNMGNNSQTNFSELCYAKSIDTISFGNVEKLTGKTNGLSNDAHPSITSDGKTMYFTKNTTDVLFYNPKKGNEIEVNNDGTSFLNIYVSHNIDGQWSAPKRLSFNSKDYSCAYPFIDKDGKTLYFSSNKPGGFGGFDIYKARLTNDSTFFTPENLGNSINSSDDDFAPRIYDSKFYYSSRGKIGFGGADIFSCSIGPDNALGSPINLGIPFNSSKDDFYILFKENNKEGYFASNRDGLNGQDRLYYFQKIPPPSDTLSGIVLDRITNAVLQGVEISLYEINNTGDSTFLRSTNTDVNGHWEFIVSSEKKYNTRFSLKDYYPKQFMVPLSSKGNPSERALAISTLKEVKLNPLVKKNNIVKINNIYFDFNKALVRPESYEILNNLVDFLKENPSANIELSAHTDGAGNDKYNLKLSDDRAKSCYYYLGTKGIDLKRITPKGYGETKLLNNCKDAKKCSDMENQLNRRVEVKFL